MGLYRCRSLKSHSLRSVMDGKGVGPTGSVQVSSKILPMDTSRSFTTATSVFSSFAFTTKAFLANLHDLWDRLRIYSITKSLI